MTSKLIRACLALGLWSYVGCSAHASETPPDRGTPVGAVGGTSAAGAPGAPSPSAGAAHGGAPGAATAGASGRAGSAAAGSAASSGGMGAAGMPPAVGGVPSDVTLPGQWLDLRDWYLTLPTGKPGDPDDVFQPQLDEFTVEPYFKIVPTGVQFRAHAGGVTTSGSHYPRSELREMLNGGADKAAWGVADGKTHTMLLTTAITHLPVVKPDAVAAQIHDASDDIVMVRLEGSKLFVEGNSVNFGVLDANYELGTPFTVKIQASSGHILVFFNDLTKPQMDIPSMASGCYFKAGIYTHSNLEKGDQASAYGEAVISALQVTHE